MRRLFILLILLCSLCLPAFGEEGFALSFTPDGAGGMLIAGYTGVPEAALLLPESAEGLPVTGLAEEALSGLAVDSLSLPRSIRTIGTGALRGSTVREIRFSYGLAEIAEEAFAGCVNLVGCAFPETLVSVGDGAFDGCTSLLYVTLPESVSQLSGNPFSGCTVLESLPMVRNHPYFVVTDGALTARADGRVICTLAPPPAEETAGK